MATEGRAGPGGGARLPQRVRQGIPYGVYDVAANASSWSSVLTVIRPPSPPRPCVAGGSGWEGPPTRRPATCSCAPTPGAPTGTGVRLWKLELARLATETDLTITVCHFPPGTSSGTGSSTGCSRPSR